MGPAATCCLGGGLGHCSGQRGGWSAAEGTYASLAVSSPGRRSHRARIGHTALEAARVIARTLALTCADCTNGGGGSGGRSAHVPDNHLSGLG